mgnify:CR=1 FL=1
MGITCFSKTARGIIKLAGNKCDEMAMVILEYQNKAVSLNSLLEQLDKLMKAPYLYFGRNRFPHKFVINGKITFKDCNQITNISYFNQFFFLR